MEPFVSFTGNAAVLDRMNVDTDQIIPKQFLKRVERTGFGQFLFFDWRFEKDGSENPSFELNQPENKGAGILIAGKNFGCGSSREHAPWALADYGIRVVIAPSFADIFYNNCLKNGLLPVVLDDKEVRRLMDQVQEGRNELTVDLRSQTVTDEAGTVTSFEMDSYWKEMLLEGKDEIALSLEYESQIAAYEQKQA
ncbi:MAG TPA: 3-isopropylmalate dehydratase small subunit [Bacillales bacterium]|nr:3-isopropylmalate dehydratase small subunit [Bacillales bacterium]